MLKMIQHWLRERSEARIERRRTMRRIIENTLRRWRGPKMTGRELRAVLAECGYRMSLPAFYRLMAAFEEEDWLMHEDLLSRVGDQFGRERWYSLRRP